jgi:hypothetical protein
MKKSQGARRSIANHVRNTSFFEDYIPSAIAKPTGKPGKKRTVIGNGHIKPNGSWAGVVPA